jgi:heme exporter protein B
MTAFRALLQRDIVLALRLGGGVTLAIGFFLLVVAVFTFGIGPDLPLLAKIAPGMLWAAMLLSALLTLDRLVQGDFEDGSLDILAAGTLPLELGFTAKALAHWVTTGVPLSLAAPLLGVLVNLDPIAILPLVATMLAGTIAISFTGMIGAALTVALRRGGLLTAILVLPLYVPVLIFGVSAVRAAIGGMASFTSPFLLLCAISIASVVLGPIAAAAAIRTSWQ